MSSPVKTAQDKEELPDHTMLPIRNENEMLNAQEHPGSNLLTESIRPRLRELFPNGHFFIGCSVSVYFAHLRPPADPLDGRRAPDWFYVPGVPPMLDGQHRRSYVLWREHVKPGLVVEFASGDGSEERDATHQSGKFWVYEQAIGAAYYAILDPRTGLLEVYQLVAGRYQRMQPNAHGRFLIAPLRLELGVWHGCYREQTLFWLRAWIPGTNQLVLVSEELVELGQERLNTVEKSLGETTQRLSSETTRANTAETRANTAEERAARLAAKLREMGIAIDV